MVFTAILSHRITNKVKQIRNIKCHRSIWRWHTTAVAPLLIALRYEAGTFGRKFCKYIGTRTNTHTHPIQNEIDKEIRSVPAACARTPIFHVSNGPISFLSLFFVQMMLMMICKLNWQQVIHFHHRSFQAKPTLTQTFKSQLYHGLCLNVRRKRNAKFDTTLSNCKRTNKQSFKKLMHYRHTGSKFVHHVRCFVLLFWKKWILVGDFHATNRQFHGFRIGVGIILTWQNKTKQIQIETNETKVNRKGSPHPLLQFL